MANTGSRQRIRLIVNQPREGREMNGNEILRHGVLISGAPCEGTYPRKNFSIDPGDGFLNRELHDFRIVRHKRGEERFVAGGQRASPEFIGKARRAGYFCVDHFFARWIISRPG